MRRVDGRLHSQMGTLIVLQAVRIAALFGSFLVWFWCMERVAELTVTGPVAVGAVSGPESASESCAAERGR